MGERERGRVKLKNRGEMKIKRDYSECRRQNDKDYF